MKYRWYYCKVNGMIGKYRYCPNDNWLGPYDTVRELREATQHLSVELPKMRVDASKGIQAGSGVGE